MRVPRPSKCFLAVPEVFRFSFVTAEIFNLKIDFFFHSRTLQGPFSHCAAVCLEASLEAGGVAAVGTTQGIAGDA
jgi:hypothetical protein